MKSILILLLFGLSTTIFAQLTPEHCYQSTNLQRINLTYSGEKYYTYTAGISQVNLFNADHSPWKTLALNVPVGASLRRVYHVSEAKINPDSLLEVIFSFSDSSGSKTQLFDEQGVQILDSLEYIDFWQQEGLPDKLHGSKNGLEYIYALPSLNVEASYPSSLNPQRVKLDVSGEKYVVHDFQMQKVDIYNLDFTLWKTINYPPDANAMGSNPLSFSENIINTDSLLEVIVHYSSPSYGYTRIIDELGVVLYAYPNANVHLSVIDGFSNKLMVDSSYSTKVYSLPNPTLEHNYSIKMSRKYFPLYGVNYVSAGFPIDIYDDSHNHWKTIQLGPSLIYGNSLEHISANKINSNPSFEFIYGNTVTGAGLTNYFGRALSNENGDTIIFSHNISRLFVSEIDTFANKIIAYFSTSTFTGSRVDSICVYDASTYTAIQKIAVAHNPLEIFPNPTQGLVQLALAKNERIHYALYSAQGALLLNGNFEGNWLELNIEAYPAGLYILKVQGEDKIERIGKIIRQ